MCVQQPSLVVACFGVFHPWMLGGWSDSSIGHLSDTDAREGSLFVAMQVERSVSKRPRLVKACGGQQFSVGSSWSMGAPSHACLSAPGIASRWSPPGRRARRPRRLLLRRRVAAPSAPGAQGCVDAKGIETSSAATPRDSRPHLLHRPRLESPVVLPSRPLSEDCVHHSVEP